VKQEHDEGGGGDGRGDFGGGGDRRADAADAGTHSAGAAGGSAGDRGVFEQVRHGGRSGAAGAGGAGSARAAEELSVSWGYHSDHPGQRAAGAERRRQVGDQDRRADGSGG